MELQFRAWDDKRFTFSHEYKVKGDTSGDTLAKFFDDCFGCEFHQWTGRHDAEIEGTPVYDGDIIENCDTKALQLVYWNNDKCAWYCRYIEDEKRIVSLSDSLGNLNKVIGNVKEASHLMSGRHEA